MKVWIDGKEYNGKETPIVVKLSEDVEYIAGEIKEGDVILESSISSFNHYFQGHKMWQVIPDDSEHSMVKTMDGIFRGNEQDIIYLLTMQDVKNICGMPPEYTRYAVFPEGWGTKEEMLEWMSI